MLVPLMLLSDPLRPDFPALRSFLLHLPHVATSFPQGHQPVILPLLLSLCSYCSFTLAMLSALTPSPARRPARCRYKRNSLNAKYDRRIGALEGAGEAQARAAQLDVARRGVEHAVQQRQNKVLELFDVNAGVRGGNGPTLPFSKPNPVSYSEAKNRIIMGGSGPLRVR